MDWSPTRPHWAVALDLLPAELPTPVQHQACHTGPVLTVRLRDGSEIQYRCNLPSTIRRGRDRLIALAQARTASERAEDACRAAAPHDFVNAQPTTVGEIHAIPGPVNTMVHAFSSVLAHLPAADFAAWCWRQPTPHNYASYVVGPNGEVVDTHSTSNGEPPPNPGPPILT